MDLNIDTTKPQHLNIVIPDEPPFGSVVLDDEGRAWQADWAENNTLIWRSAGPRNLLNFGGNVESGWGRWAQLCAQKKRLTLIYRP